MGFDFDHATRQRLGYHLVDRINAYFDSLSDRPVQLPADQRTFGTLADGMPEAGADPLQALDEICTELIDKGFHVPSAHYFGLMNPTPSYAAVLAEALVAALNPQLATHARSQLASKIEHETVRWIGERVGWSGPFGGTFTSGGNEANFTALALALAARFPGVVEDGVASIGARPVVYASSEAHHSLDKSVGLLGLGRKAIRRIPVTPAAEMDIDALERSIADDLQAGYTPLCVVATAGTTNSGATDPLESIADVAERHGLWLHVDGAYGAAAIFSDRHRDLLRGIERADSITIDPHKWLAMPFAAGTVLTSRPEMLAKTFGIQTPYMPRTQGTTLEDNFKLSVQWSRRMNSLKLWLTLRMHGRRAYEELIDRQLALAAALRERLCATGLFELATPQRLPILNVRLHLPAPLAAEMTEDERAALHAAMVEAVTHDGRQWISSTRVAGRSVLRMMVISYLTGERHVEELVGALTAAAAATLQRLPTGAVR